MEQGKIFKFHNDLDTDQIIASQYLLLPNLDEMKGHTFESLDPDFAKESKAWRFCCRRREFWLRFFQRTGTRCFKSSGRQGCYCKIFCHGFSSEMPSISDFRPLSVKIFQMMFRQETPWNCHMSEGTAEANGKTYTCTKLPEYMQQILNQGGLIASLNKEED